MIGVGINTFKVCKTSDNADPTNSRSNSEESPKPPKSTTDKKVSRTRRHKPIRSCTFCRKRKLKCDQMKPICSSCRSRDFMDCSYTDGQTTVDTSVFSSNSTCSPVDIIQTASSQVVVSPRNVSESGPNPFKNYYYVQQKKHGRIMVYGPTSLRTFISRNNWGFHDKYEQLWDKIKVERNSWKKRNLLSYTSEMNLMELDLGGVSTLEDILPCLPDWDSIKSDIDSFFNPKNANLYEINTCLDKNKIMNDFKFAFIQDMEGKIIKIQPSGKKNFFNVGVIIMILSFVRYRQIIPVQISKFLVFLNGFVSSKISYVENAQFLVLRCFYQTTYVPKSDNSEFLNLINQAANVAISIGLHLNIREGFFGQEYLFGSIESIENLWTWILFLDFDLSMKMGKPLNIGLGTFHDFDNNDLEATTPGVLINGIFSDKPSQEVITLLPPHNLNTLSTGKETITESVQKDGRSQKARKRSRDHRTEDSFFGKTRRFLYIARPMVMEFHQKTGTPNILGNSKALLKFLEDEFLPIKYVTDSKLITQLPFSDLRLIAITLHSTLTILSLGFVVLNHRSMLLKNISIQIHLITFAMFKNVVKMCHELDKKEFPEFVHPSCKILPPYLSACVGVMLNEILGSLSIFYAFFFLKATLFENGISISNDMVEVDWDITTFEVPTDRTISLISTYTLYKNIFEDLLSSDKSSSKGFELRNLMMRSYSCLVLISLERISRIVVEKALEYRKKTEDLWIKNKDVCTRHPDPLSFEPEFSTRNINLQPNDTGKPCPLSDFQIREKQLYHSYVQYQVHLEQQRHIQELQDELEGQNQVDIEKSNIAVIPDFNKATTDTIRSGTDILESKDSNVLLSSDTYNKNGTYVGQTTEFKLHAQEVETAHKLADEFWDSYNTGWEELLNDPELQTLFDSQK